MVVVGRRRVCRPEGCIDFGLPCARTRVLAHGSLDKKICNSAFTSVFTCLFYRNIRCSMLLRSRVWLATRLVSSVALSLFLVLVSLGGRRDGGGVDVNVHADAACDIRLCFYSYILLLSWGGGWAGGWVGDVDVHRLFVEFIMSHCMMLSRLSCP